jgi:hypothetical protein
MASVRKYAALLVLLIAGSAGCGGGYDATVAGAVSLDGNPLHRGTVSFAPQSAGSAAFGVIKGDGTYSLKTGRGEGLPPGAYVATVAADEAPAVSQSKDGGPPPPGKPITPDWYRNPATSGLTFEVEPGENTIDLKLTSTPPPGWKPRAKR